MIAYRTHVVLCFRTEICHSLDDAVIKEEEEEEDISYHWRNQWENESDSEEE